MDTSNNHAQTEENLFPPKYSKIFESSAEDLGCLCTVVLCEVQTEILLSFNEQIFLLNQIFVFEMLIFFRFKSAGLIFVPYIVVSNSLTAENTGQILNVFTVTFDQFNASLRNKSINFFQKKSPNF